MNKILFFSFIAIITALVYLKFSALDSRLDGKWALEVYDLNASVIAKLKIEFHANNVESCLGGEWKKINVISYSPQRNQFYPDTSMVMLQQELSYQLNGDRLIIGRNNICDAYKHLTGNLTTTQSTGSYVSFGWEHEELGTFSIKRIGI
ncbi:hypothetical protein [Pseudoalteromonas sp. H105]|jgi:hypothetical protein|uniref:hypothetical protein n=1 Tax=Pseudoalteromonas sp. H105 TaxID=1348393 RepID=UPI00073223B4|nr:hypothetical protein [Pseudoalteromonas sp. H105]KTF18229.1 hypothetical protein ATS75_02110 [Pseudoalteromonas sp. H105]